MRHLAVLAFAIVMFGGGLVLAASSEQRIARVERGLVEFSSPAAMFHPERARLAGFKTLEDRMRHYKFRR